MSLWPRKRTYASLGSDHVTVQVRRGRSILHAKAVSVVENAYTAPEQALSALLIAEAARGTRLELVLSDTYARFFVFNHMAGVRGVAELAMMVAALFEARFGERATEWKIVFDLPPGASSGMACAVPRPLVQMCLDAGAEAGVNGVSIRPYFVAAMYAQAKRIQEDGWVVARADGQVTLGMLRNGCWKYVRTMAALPDDEPSLLVVRERMRMGVNSEDVYPVIGLGEWPGGTTRAFDMALAGIET